MHPFLYGSFCSVFKDLDLYFLHFILEKAEAPLTTYPLPFTTAAPVNEQATASIPFNGVSQAVMESEVFNDIVDFSQFFDI